MGNDIFIYSDLFLTMDSYIIYRGFYNQTPEKAAIKKYSEFNVDLYEEEVNLLLKLNKANPTNFLKYFARISCDEGHYLATELAEQSIFIFIKNNFNNLVEMDLLEWMKESCEGLKTLHQMNIVHTAVEPKNILISYPDENGKRRAMLTNIRMNKKNFSNNLESISWAPFEAEEAIKNNENFRATIKGDIFSMGCVIYFVLSKGQYPFGNGINRLFDRKATLNTQEINPTYADLIESMVKFDDSERPTIEEVLIHPTFWLSEKKLQFFTDIKDVLFAKDASNMNTKDFINEQQNVIKDIEGKKQQIILQGDDWLKELGPKIEGYETNKKKNKIGDKKSKSVIELINYIRNKDQHFNELEKGVREKFGETTESYITYFLDKFPSLLIHTYNATKKLKIERKLNNYYVIE